MNPSDYDDILLDNEKNFFQTESDYGNDYELPLPIATEYGYYEKQSFEGNGMRINAHAFPQDQIPSSLAEGHNFQNANGNVPEWWSRNKVLAGLSGIFFLERVQNRNDESGINNIDVDNLMQSERNLGLNKFFAESDSEDIRIHEHHARTSANPNIASNNQFNKPATEPEVYKMSFFKDYLTRLFDENWVTALNNHTSFYEFDKAFDVKKHTENIVYLEDSFQDSGLGAIFNRSKHNTVVKIKQLLQNQAMNAETLIRCVHSELCETMLEVFSFIQNAESDFCLNVIKANTGINTGVTNGLRQDQIIQNKPVIEPEFAMPQFKPKFEEDKRIDLEFSQHPNDVEDSTKQNMSFCTSELESVASETKKGQRKLWSEAEKDDLEKLRNQFNSRCIPTEKLEEFAKKYGRSLKSVQSKISKEKNKKDKDYSDNESLAQSTSNSIKKYEHSREKMIQNALLTMLNNTGTKDEIFDKISELYYQNQDISNEEALKNSVSQILSSGKNIQKIKGEYGLKSQRYILFDDTNLTSMKVRLQYILSNLQNYRGDIDTIRKRYWSKFQDDHKYDKEKVWESSIVKILRQSEEFDSSNSKTKYKLIKDTP